MTALLVELRRVLAAHGDPQRAADQQRYMKSTLPFHGISSPKLKRLLRPVLAEYRLPDVGQWRATARELWDTASHREERYATVALLRHRHYREWARDPAPATVELLRHLVLTGAWWDLVDDIATHCIADLLQASPGVMTPILMGWATEPDLWLRRTAILSQIGRRGATDLDLLVHAIGGSVADGDFFARKAIGWALRDYSKTDAAWVENQVAEQSAVLSPLSQREALKWLTAAREQSPPGSYPPQRPTSQ